MKNRPEIVAMVLLVVLTAYAAAHQIFLIPVVQYLLANTNAPISLPGRISISLSQYGFAGFLIFVGATLYALRKIEPSKDRIQQAGVMNVASIVVTLFILLQASLYVDMLKSAPTFLKGAQTASVTK